MKILLFVALGGALGASCRYGAGIAAAHFGSGHFPWGTFAVNVAGSFLLGMLAAILTFSWSPSPEIRAFLVVGVLGGFTTFSAFSLDVALLIERDRLVLAAIYLVGTVALSVGGLFAGLRLTRMVLT
ncbi:MAG: CrcB protein [Paracoccaceae bacterium]|jgi:CrcB protein